MTTIYQRRRLSPRWILDIPILAEHLREAGSTYLLAYTASRIEGLKFFQNVKAKDLKITPFPILFWLGY